MRKGELSVYSLDQLLVEHYGDRVSGLHLALCDLGGHVCHRNDSHDFTAIETMEVFDNKRYHNSLPIFADDRHLLKVVLTEDFDGVVAGEVRFYSDSFWVVKHTDWLVPPPSRREVRGCGDRTIEVILTICPRHPPLCRDPGTR